MTTLPPRREIKKGNGWFQPVRQNQPLNDQGRFPREIGAGKESRTPDLNLGKVALYQLSYSRVS
jgi:hypothetical protein